MKKLIVFYIFENWYCYNIDSKKESILSMQKILQGINKNDRIFSSQVDTFIKEYDNIDKNKDLPDIIDIESYSKQFLQKSKPLENQEKWNLFKLLKEKFIIPSEFRITEENIFDYLGKIAEYLQVISEETSAYEEDRFNDIEIDINRIIYERQRKGINVDVEIAKQKIQLLEEEVYQIKNRLQLEFRIFSPEKIAIQSDWLNSNKISINGSLERTFKNYSDENIVCGLFYELIRIQKDLDCYLDILAYRGGKTKTFPCYFGFGTITSRITLREPGLQNIRKENRSVIQPEPGYEFIYIDYSQFEAGILASLSDDEKLINLYNDDIYSDIALKIYKDKEKREKAKILFYRYMYGDTFKNTIEKRYFSKFVKLQSYKKKIEKEAEKNKLIGTEFGNYRIIDENFTISLSHKIQGTASLIFKKALIRAYQEIPEAEFVLPMHDAALYQISLKHDLEEVTEKLKKIFKDVFKVHCPKINPIVNERSFTE